MATTETCKWCGHSNTRKRRALGFTKVNADYCSRSCQVSVLGRNHFTASVEQKSKRNKNVDSFLTSVVHNEDMNLKERRIERSLELKAENKPLMAFFTRNGPISIVVSTGVVVLTSILIITGYQNADRRQLLYWGVAVATIVFCVSLFILIKLTREYATNPLRDNEV